VIVAAAGLITCALYGVSSLWQSPELERSHRAMRDEAAAYAAMLNQEVGLRGYLLTRDARFLEPYIQGRAELARANETLVAHVGSVPSGDLAVAMVRTRLAEEKWQERWARAAADTGPGAAIASMSESKALFDQYRREHAAFGQALNERRDRLYERGERMTLARVLFELLAFIAILFLAVRQHRTLRAAIVDRRIRDGELAASADPVGPRELAELAEGRNEMVGALGEARAIESARLHEAVEERSQVDALTMLLNGRRLDEDLDAECRRCTRYARPLAVVMLDVDHFKAFNDSHGHPTADKALQEVAAAILGCMRTTDTAYRYGGEEFCVILRETSGEDGVIFAERVRLRIEQRFASGGMPGITASFGVASFGEDATTPRTLLEAADAAMYESKHAGRNRVMLSSRPPFGAPLAVATIDPH
jgi:diguanylate cyclase (GGDEF)-like protein